MLFFQEDIISQNPGDCIEVRHLKLKGSNYEIGKKLAELARDRHGIKKTTDGDPLRIHCQRLYLQKNYPVFYQRMRGMASAYSLPLENDLVDFNVLGKSNIGMGCSAVYYPPDCTATGHGMISRNLDFLTTDGNACLGREAEEGEVLALAKTYLLEMYPDNGYPSLTLMSFELFGEALDGINSEGLIVAHLADNESLNKFPMEPTMGSSVGLGELKCVQFLLDTCANAAEAKEALLLNKHYYAFVPVHLLVADCHGNSFVWEYSHAHNKEYIMEGAGKPQVVTNFLLHRYKSLEDIPVESEDKGCPYNRYRTLYQTVTAHSERFSKEFMKKANRLVFMDDGSFPTLSRIPVRTIMHSLYDSDERSLEVSFHLRDEADFEQPGGKRPVRSGYFKFKLK